MNLSELQALLVDLNVTESHAMNMLQDGGIISDNCVHLSDIVAADIEMAYTFIALELS